MAESIDKLKEHRVIFIAYDGFSDWECGIVAWNALDRAMEGER